MKRLPLLTVALSLLPGLLLPAHAQAPNICDWTGPWLAQAPLVSKRDGATATRLQDGKVLIAGGFDGSNTVAAAELYDPATDTFTLTGSMGTGRTGHVAALLPDGRVLIAGGFQISGGIFAGRLSTAEVFQPASGTFAPVASMSTDRQSAAAVLLANGKVLVSGGFGNTGFGFSGWLPSADLFDPNTNAFFPTGSMATGRGLHQATRLPSGKVLMSGGTNAGGATASGELYDPVSQTFSATGALKAARQSHTATLMPNGFVILTGGSNSSGALATTETFDPATNTFSLGSVLMNARASHTATLLPIGKLLITGGETAAGAIASAEITDEGGFVILPPLPTPRTNHAAVLLSGGNVLLLGGRFGANQLDTAVLFDPLFSGTGAMGAARSEHTATRLGSGQVLIAGGQSTDSGLPPLASAEIYTPASRSFAPTGSMSTPRHFHTATLLDDGKVLVAGGLSAFTTGILSSAELFDPMTGIFKLTSPLLSGRYKHTATRLPNGRILIAGGRTTIGSTATAELYDPVKNVFVKTGQMLHDRQDHTATLLPNGKVLITGGLSSAVGGITYSTELYDPATGSFTQPPQAQWLLTNRSRHVATLLANGKVLITGGFTSGNTPTDNAEVYDPNNGFFSAAGDMSTPRAGHAVTETSMPNGEVLVIGGAMSFSLGFLDTVEIFSPTTGAFTLTGSMFVNRLNVTATLLLDSTVLVVGGVGESFMGATAELSKPTRCGPAITMLSPTSGPVGTPVSISGTQFGGQQGGSSVTFNGTPAGISSWGETSISTNVPGGATSGPVIVTVNGRDSNAVNFIVGSPDLIIQSIVTNPASPAPGQTADVTVTAKNQGAASAGIFLVDFYEHSAGPPAGWGNFACGFDGLAPGATVECNGTVTYGSAGTYNMWAQVDLDQFVPESNESNNVFGPQSISVQSGSPDLVETAVSNPPATVVLGSSFAVTDTADNAGSGPAGSSTTRYYLSLDAVKNSTDKRLSGNRAVGALNPADPPSTGTVNVTVPSNTVLGLYFLIACADDLKVVTETSETNNCVSSATKVQVTSVDLVETAVSNPPATGLRGSTFAVSDTVLNQGTGTAGTSTTRYYLSLDAIRNAGDKLLAGTRPVSTLGPGVPSSGNTTVTIPTNTALGHYFLLACADDLTDVSETNEANNCIASAAKVQVVAHDLVETSVSNPPASAIRGSSFAVTDSVLNQGDGFAGTSTTRYYLSLDTIRNSGDKLMAGTRLVPSLQAGNGSSNTVTITIPATTVPAMYHLLACADDLKKVAESNETNNCIASSAKVNVLP